MKKSGAKTREDDSQVSFVSVGQKDTGKDGCYAKQWCLLFTLTGKHQYSISMAMSFHLHYSLYSITCQSPYNIGKFCFYFTALLH